MVLNLGMTKSAKRRGAPESVNCSCRLVCKFVAYAIQGFTPGDFIFDGSGPAFRQKFDRLLRELKLENAGYRPYSLRRGGATAAFRGGLTWQAVAKVGRWSLLATLRIYVTEALVELQRLRTLARVWKAILAEAAEMQALLE